MSLNTEHFVSSDERLFEVAVIELRNRQAFATSDIAQILDALGSDGFLSVSERQRRTQQTLARLGLSSTQILNAWEHTARRSLAVQGAVAAALPPALKPQVLVPQKISNTSVRNHSILPEPTAVTSAQPLPNRQGITDSIQASRAIVILVGDENEFSTTTALLAGRHLPYIIRETIGDVLPQELASACGIVVGKSRYQNLNAEEQLKILCEIARSNGQALIRIGADGLAPDNLADLECFRDKLGYSKARAESIHIPSQSALTLTELGFLAPYARRVDESMDSSLLVDGLTTQQGMLVTQAVRKELSRVGLDHLRVSAMHVQVMSGRSGATVLSVRVDGCHYPFILRLSTKYHLLESKWNELDKIKKLIMPWRPGLLPAVYTIGNDAVLIYSSVTSSSRPEAVAITLGERLRQIQAYEPPHAPQGLPDTDNLASGIEEAFNLLGGLNKTQGTGNPTNYKWVLEDYALMAAEGRQFRFDVPVTQLETLLQQCLEVLSVDTFDAVSHGDPHTSNVLLPADSHAELIDFERVNLGHPLYDICHLTLSIAATSYRSYGTFEEVVSEFSHALFGAKPDVAEEAYAASRVNETVVHSLACARKTAKDLEHHYNLTPRSFPAMLITVSTIVLILLPHLQVQVAKAIIVASERRLVSLAV